MTFRRARTLPTTAITVLALILGVLSPNATAAPRTHKPSKTVTITGRANWVIYLGPVYVANGAQAGCYATNGELTVWGGKTARVLKHVAQHVTVQSHTLDQYGSESWQCNMNYKVTVPREPKYAINWQNGSPYENYGCDNSKTTADAQIWTDNKKTSKYTRPVISFTYLCTDDGY